MATPPQNAEQAELPPPPPPANPGVEIRQPAFIIHVPDIRNGDFASIQQAAPKSSIDSAYKWAAIGNLTPAMAVRAVEYVIRATYAVIINAAGAGATDATRTEARRKAIILGGVRAGAMAAYNLANGDMTITECVNSGYEIVGNNIRARGDLGTAGGKFALAQSMPALDVVEIDVVAMLVYLGFAVPVLQGASLVSSGHHYLPTTANIFAGQKKQAMSILKDQARAMVESLGTVFEDMAFHKACHPISPPFKRRLAKDSNVATRLRLSGHGAAAIRLPALPSDAAIGKTGVALVLAAMPTIQSMGHTASVAIGQGLIRALESADEGLPEREAVARIQEWAATHAAVFAFCAGIVQHVHETAGVGENTLLRAFSVKKLRNEFPTETQRGVIYSRVAAARTRTMLEDGTFADPAIRV